MRRKIDGVLLLDKPLELSSNAALQVARRIYGAAKAGHTGTLDPLASGLLPVCFGEATKYSARMLDADKTYRAKIRLGVTTTTGDAEGEILSRCEVNVDAERVARVLQSFVGEIDQVPPMHSALKHKGKPLYAYIRSGVEIERPARRVKIHRIDLESAGSDELVISVKCSKGTYVRVLAEDICKALGCGAHLSGLVRTEIGPFSVADAHTLEELRSREDREGLLLPCDALLQDFASLRLAEEEAASLSCGRVLQNFSAAEGVYRIYSGDRFVGLAEVDRIGTLRAKRMMS